MHWEDVLTYSVFKLYVQFWNIHENIYLFSWKNLKRQIIFWNMDTWSMQLELNTSVNIRRERDAERHGEWLRDAELGSLLNWTEQSSCWTALLHGAKPFLLLQSDQHSEKVGDGETDTKREEGKQKWKRNWIFIIASSLLFFFAAIPCVQFLSISHFVYLTLSHTLSHSLYSLPLCLCRFGDSSIDR